jgi:hypothetical protein
MSVGRRTQFLPRPPASCAAILNSPQEPLTIRELARTRCAICDADLPAEGTAIVALADKSIRRMTFQELDSLDATETPADDFSRPLFVFRCCSAACLERAERAFAEAPAAEA